MRCGCAGPLLTCAKDRRVTSVGRLLRPLELDELPQFFNIVRGDMTLVGPRPETPGLACRYPPQCRWVFAHRPGLTGPVQLRSQGLAALIEDKDDPESWYLAVLVPRRVALDAQFLSAPTLARTLALITQTAWYMLSSVLRVRQLLKRSPMEAHSHANHHGLLAPRPRPRNAARHAPAASGPAADQGPAR
jgi:lipopolysaccharide/colanic/teichoic acid biosynthesis glycosyltransferase